MDLARAFINFNAAGQLTPEIEKALTQHENPLILLLAFILYEGKDLLAAQNDLPTNIAEHSNLWSLVRAVEMLKEKNLLIEPYLDHVINHKDPLSLAQAFQRLEQQRLLIDPYLEHVINHEDPLSLVRALEALQEEDLLIAEPFLIEVLQHKKPHHLAGAFAGLQRNNLLIERRRLDLSKQEQPYELACAFIRLNRHNELHPRVASYYWNALCHRQSFGDEDLADLYRLNSEKCGLDDQIAFLQTGRFRPRYPDTLFVVSTTTVVESVFPNAAEAAALSLGKA